MYFAFVRPVFEYGCGVWDSAPRHDFLFNEMERMQIQAAIIVTGTNNNASYYIWKQCGPIYLNDANIIVWFYFTKYHTA